MPHLFIILNNFDEENWTKERQPTICEMLDRHAALPARRYLNCTNFDDICLRVGKNQRDAKRHFVDNLIIIKSILKYQSWNKTAVFLINGLN